MKLPRDIRVRYPITRDYDETKQIGTLSLSDEAALKVGEVIVPEIRMAHITDMNGNESDELTIISFSIVDIKNLKMDKYPEIVGKEIKS